MTYIGVDNTPRRLDIAPELRRTLAANGMQAQITRKEDGSYKLIAFCHDTQTPFYYDITDKQLTKLVNGGTANLNKQAYQTFVELVKDDFHVPQSYVAANNVNSPVRMGLHGYTLAPGEYGIGSPRPFDAFRGPAYGPFDGSLVPRQMVPVTRMRRIGGRLFFDDRSPIVAERPDGRLRPGELTSGSYGFYTKNSQEKVDKKKAAVVEPKRLEMSEAEKKNVQTLKSITWYDAKQGLATGKTFNDMLSTHGIILDKDNKTLTIKAKGSIKDYTYDIRDDEAKVLFNDKMKVQSQKGKKIVTYNEKDGSSVDERLACLNKILSQDYEDKVTPQKLNEQDYISLKRKDGEQPARQAIDQSVQYAQDNDIIDLKNAREDYRTGFIDRWNSIGVVDGRALDPSRGFYVPQRNGRALSVGEIQTYPSNDGGDRGTTFKMSAVINERVFTHEISREDYVKFLNYDDEHRLELFDKTFDEVSIKSSRNGQLQDNFKATRLDEAKGIAKLGKSYSFLTSDGEASTITSAMAWKDEVSGDYVMNVRDGKDAGMWSFKISEEQYLAFRAGSDEEKAKLVERVFPWREDFKGKVAVLPTSMVDGLFDEKGAMRELSPKVLEDLRKHGLSFEPVAKTEARVFRENVDLKLKPQEETGQHAQREEAVRTNAAMGKEGKTYVRERYENYDWDDIRAQTRKNLSGDAGVNGESLANQKGNKMWVRSGENGRETSIGDIAVTQVKDAEGKPVEASTRCPLS